MKLDHAMTLAVFAAALTACAPPARRVAEAPRAPVVGTTTLMTADVTGAEEAPRVSKSYRANLVEQNFAKEETERRVGHKPGGGFSGYK